MNARARRARATIRDRRRDWDEGQYGGLNFRRFPLPLTAQGWAAYLEVCRRMYAFLNGQTLAGGYAAAPPGVSSQEESGVPGGAGRVGTEAPGLAEKTTGQA